MPRSMTKAGTGKKKKQRMRTMATAKPMSLPPLRLVAGTPANAVLVMLCPSSQLSTRVRYQACASLPIAVVFGDDGARFATDFPRRRNADRDDVGQGPF